MHLKFTAALALATIGSVSLLHADPQLPADVRLGAGVVPPTRVVQPPAVRLPPPPPVRRTVPPPIAFPFPGTPLPLIGGRSSQDFRFQQRPFGMSPYAPNAYGSGFAYGGGYYGGAGYYAGEPNAVDPSSVAAQQAPHPTGMLRLSMTPSSAQVFVDSYYVGTVADIEAQRILTLDAGPHRLEMRAPGYETLNVDVRVPARETITYQGALDLTRAPAAARASTASSNPMYLIPNCYLGNVPPRANRLPSGCDIKQVQVLDRK